MGEAQLLQQKRPVLDYITVFYGCAFRRGDI
jgi:hypothetical protein